MQIHDNISATVICDSVGPSGVRLSTLLLTYPYWVHAQVLTHRVFSRNAASNRAIPLAKQIQRVRDNVSWPVWWGAAQAGMSADKQLEGEALEKAQQWWQKVIDTCLALAEEGTTLGGHKEWVSRVLMPIMPMTLLVSATSFNNFIKLRSAGTTAQHEIQVLTERLKVALAESKPVEKFEGEWHLPFITGADWNEVEDRADLIKISVARCARTSYLTHDGRRAVGEDIALHDRLVREGHFSPTEHVARALRTPTRIANFVGWQQYRSSLPGEDGES